MTQPTTILRAMALAGQTALAAALSLLPVSGAVAASPCFTATVVAVSDGDTVTVERADDTRVKVRLRYVDCPEVAHNRRQTDQPGGKEAKEFASKLLLREGVTICPHGTSYGRIIGNITVGGKDAALLLVEHGHAQLDPRYKPPKALRDAEAEAKRADVGLWAGEGEPVPPWEYRKQQRERLIELRRGM